MRCDSFKQTSETLLSVGSRSLTQVVAHWVPGSLDRWQQIADALPAETVSRHNNDRCLTERRCGPLATSEIVSDRNAVEYRGPLWWRQLCTIDTSLELQYFTHFGTSSQWKSTCISCLRPRTNFLESLTITAFMRHCNLSVIALRLRYARQQQQYILYITWS